MLYRVHKYLDGLERISTNTTHSICWTFLSPLNDLAKKAMNRVAQKHPMRPMNVKNVLNIIQGMVTTYLRSGGIFTDVATHLLPSHKVQKNFENRSALCTTTAGIQ